MSTISNPRVLPWRRYGAPISIALAPLLDVYQEQHADAPVDRIVRAYHLAFEAHSGQFRKSGAPYISHPLAVAKIVAANGLDDVTICAALLHDAVEDTSVRLDEIEESFGADVAALVDGVTKLERANFDNKEAQQAATMRKMLVAFSKDIRVLIIKLADRLHNMRTVAGMPVWKQERTARETLEIYAPLAHRLGMSEIRQQLEDLAFATIWPRRYAEIEHLVMMRDPERDLYVAQVMGAADECLKTAGIDAELIGRPKHLWSIYEKMVIKGMDFNQIHDLIGVRVVVENRDQCYIALGRLHGLWQPVFGRFKDYIGSPKFNEYRSMHTTVIGPGGNHIELQIRTREMEERAELGIASHWIYKAQKARKASAAAAAGGGGEAAADGSVETEASATDLEGPDSEMPWLTRILDWQETSPDPAEFMENLKADLDDGEVYVTTPKGQAIPLQAGATPVDFAYAIHTEIGHACQAARVDGKQVPLDTRLVDGNTVEILTSDALEASPSEDWLDFVVSAKAKGKIRSWFSKESRFDARVNGREQLSRALRREGLPPNVIDNGDFYTSVAEQMGYSDTETLDEAIGQHHVRVAAVVARIGKEMAAVESTTGADTLPSTARRRRRGRPANEGTGVHVEGLDDVLVRLSGCCTPVPPDEIMGFATRGRGVSVHRVDCANAVSLATQQGQRLMEVEWDLSSGAKFTALVELKALDRIALLSDIATTLAEARVNIISMSTLTGDDRVARMRFEFQLGDGAQLGGILAKLKRIGSVYDAYRVMPKSG